MEWFRLTFMGCLKMTIRADIIIGLLGSGTEKSTIRFPVKLHQNGDLTIQLAHILKFYVLALLEI